MSNQERIGFGKKLINVLKAIGEKLGSDGVGDDLETTLLKDMLKEGGLDSKAAAELLHSHKAADNAAKQVSVFTYSKAAPKKDEEPGQDVGKEPNNRKPREIMQEKVPGVADREREHDD